MSLFNSYTANKPEENITEQEAWIAVLYACSITDGEASEIETELIVDSLYRKQKFEGIEFSPLFRKVLSKRTELGQNKFLDYYIPYIKEEDFEMLFCIALEIVLVDGIIHREEERIIEILINKMSLNTEKAKVIIDIFITKNKGNVSY
ncbi:hypothetical protein J2X97_000392 [Epilithonimonas hungarica]|uniref:hypothetical protein n=1 Tax=Epilithonimonas hungarica TaxID=454006 RepID=UPI0027867019|nr:hypothetical protein [Epilithonimonas hungarica]MDP9954755.1 hypothetical protein [Epilithonimonas hungarica]